MLEDARDTFPGLFICESHRQSYALSRELPQGPRSRLQWHQSVGNFVMPFVSSRSL